jgi:hypothetical protein
MDKIVGYLETALYYLVLGSALIGNGLESLNALYPLY